MNTHGLYSNLEPDDVVCYEWGDITRPAHDGYLASPGPAYTPVSPALIVGIDSTDGGSLLWARVYRLIREPR